MKATSEITYSHQRIYIEDGEKLYNKYRKVDNYIKCPVCKGFVKTSEMWLDNDGKNKHSKCLSKERVDEIRKGLNA